VGQYLAQGAFVVLAAISIAASWETTLRAEAVPVTRGKFSFDTVGKSSPS